MGEYWLLSHLLLCLFHLFIGWTWLLLGKHQHLEGEIGDPLLAEAQLLVELTKLHEEFYRGTVSGCLEWLEANSPRGEFCLVLGAGDGAVAATEEELEPLDEVRKLMADGVDKKAALAQVAKKRKIPKRELYNQLISEGDGSDND